ncbi:MAG TPA: S8/S53 family peptidase [Thermoanaerobaculia bacterium]|nr:S8/S53 family peptidase [Thermoanaerobaculia bacterium]
MSSEIVRFDRACAALSPSGVSRSPEAEARESLAAHFLSQVGHLEGLSGFNGRPGVRLAFLDTQPDGEGVPTRPGRSRHGYTLANIGRRLLCGPGPTDGCVARITTRLALPIVEFDRLNPKKVKVDTVNGGFIGMQIDLAQAIEREVDAWLGDPHREPHLVLNLSLAWDGELFHGLDEKSIAEMEVGTQAVYRALEYAAGHGVLVFAAAGNRQYGPSPNTGPLLPAAWEGRRVEDSCGTSRETPLLYAVGGVQSGGWPLANARPRGMPRRVAYADHAVVSALNPDEPTAMYTGSSVATAVTSSIAAAAWMIRPELDAHELMKILDASGDPLEWNADFWFGADPAPRARRLSLCSAFREVACSGTDLPDCRALLECDWDRQRPFLSDILTILPPGPSRFSEVPDVSKPCLATRMVRNGNSARPPRCPSDRLFSITAEPWLFPMPGVTPCPNCVILPPPDGDGNKENVFAALAADRSPEMLSYTLRGVIREDWKGGCLTDATLDIEQFEKFEQFEPRVAATRRISVELGGAYCSPGQSIKEEIQIPADIEFNERTTVTLGFIVQRDHETPTSSDQSPVLIAR